MKKTHPDDIAKINAELAELFESDVKEFSANGAKAFGHIFAKYGIIDPEKWLEKKIRKVMHSDVPPYSYTPNELNTYCDKYGNIHFNSPHIASDKFVRAHEVAHKITLDFMDMVCDGEINHVRCSGFSISDAEIKANKITRKLEIIYSDGSKCGFDFNEGVTNLIAEKLSGINHTNQSMYYLQTYLARQVAEIISEDIVFESAFFNPNILLDKWSQLTGDKYSFLRIMHSLDESRRLQGRLLRAGNSELKRIYKLYHKTTGKALSEVRKYMPIAKKVKYTIKRIYKIYFEKWLMIARSRFNSSSKAQSVDKRDSENAAVQTDKAKRTSARWSLHCTHEKTQSNAHINRVKLKDNSFDH